jgi:predicted HTH domain antitoxin
VIKRELAAFFFQRGVLSFGQARQFAGLSVWDFLEFLRERKIPLHYDIYYLKHEITK